MFIYVIQERFNFFTMGLSTMNEARNPNFVLRAGN